MSEGFWWNLPIFVVGATALITAAYWPLIMAWVGRVRTVSPLCPPAHASSFPVEKQGKS